jgi:hypothetical protein
VQYSLFIRVACTLPLLRQVDGLLVVGAYCELPALTGSIHSLVATHACRVPLLQEIGGGGASFAFVSETGDEFPSLKLIGDSVTINGVVAVVPFQKLDGYLEGKKADRGSHG